MNPKSFTRFVRCVFIGLYVLIFCNSIEVMSCALVICGPSGVGKGSMIASFCRKFPNTTALTVSHTTRKPRPGEINGFHYHFVTEIAMQEGISRGKFLEHAKVHTNMYGTSREAVDDIQREHKIPILDVDVEGVKSIKTVDGFDAKYVFIAPPSIQVLEERLRGRDTESDDQIATRIKNAKSEVEFGTEENFDCIIVNDSLEEATEVLCQKARVWFPSISA